MTAPLFRLDKSGGRAVIAQYGDYAGHPYLDLRQWVMTGDGLRPTTKGVTVPLEAVRALGEALAASSPPPAAETP